MSGLRSSFSRPRRKLQLKINRHSDISSTCHVHYIGNQGLRSMNTSKQHLHLDGWVFTMFTMLSARPFRVPGSCPRGRTLGVFRLPPTRLPSKTGWYHSRGLVPRHRRWCGKIRFDRFVDPPCSGTDVSRYRGSTLFNGWVVAASQPADLNPSRVTWPRPVGPTVSHSPIFRSDV